MFLFTDGARKGGDGGWAFVAVLNGKEVHRDSGKEPRTSNNRMELMGILRALAWSRTYGHVDNVIIVTDSQYSITVIEAPPITNRAVPRKKNHDLIQQCKSLLTAKHRFEWVRGHGTNEWNNFADKLATAAVRDIPANAVFKPRKPPAKPPAPSCPTPAPGAL